MNVLLAGVLVFLAVSSLRGSLAGIGKPKKAKQLLSYNHDTKEFVLDTSCLVEISKLDAPIKVLSAVGDVRIGKSTTLNLIHHFWEEDSPQPFDEVFETGGTTNAVTHGVWASILPAKTPDESNAILLDVEGLNLGDDAVTTHFSLFTALVSSGVHVFARDLVQNHVLDFLYHIARHTDFIFPEKKFNNFPHLGVVMRGSLETPQGSTLEEYVQNFLLEMDNTDGKNSERKVISKYFSRDKISATQIPYVQDVTIFKDMRKLRRKSNFYPVIELLRKQFKKCPPKSSLEGNRLMSGESLAMFVKDLFHAMNNNSWIDFYDVYQTFEGRICAEAYGKIVKPVLDQPASEISGSLETKIAMFATKCALKENVVSARDDLLAAEKKAREIEEIKRKKEEEEEKREEIETEMEIAKEKWQQENEEKEQNLRKEVEKREILEQKKKMMESELNRMSQYLDKLQSKDQGGGDGGGVEQFLGSAFGAALAAGAYFFSDQRLKQNITILPHSEYDIVNLTGVGWKWNKAAQNKFGLGDAGRGVIAQEVEKVYPWAVMTRRDGYKQVNYKMLGSMIQKAKETVVARELKNNKKPF